ncbi:MAG: ATP-binding protein, partial [Planctomycetota bacterium]
MINRNLDNKHLADLIRGFPITAILGARQSGKTTLAKQLQFDHYFDLENPRDLARLDHPQLALEDLQGLIVIDEIQRKPELFTLLRYLVDNNDNQKYLILGSASRDLIQQSSESLAGRIAYYELTGFRTVDIGKTHIRKLWLRGGFPRSFLAESDEQSILWRENYISTFLERDIPQLGIPIPAQTLRRFWTMLSHYHGQLLNYSELARAFGISDTTVKKYIHILEGTFMVRLLQPWHSNTKKRLVKAPKLYLKDSGLFHSLMSIENRDQLLSHNKRGASWEGFALDSVVNSLSPSRRDVYFWSVHSGEELDLFWMQGGKNWGVEFKLMDAPKLTRSMTSVIK